MIPIKTENYSDDAPIVNYMLIAVNVVIFLYMTTLITPQLYIFFDQYSLIPALVTQGQNLKTFITAMFLHGDWMHLIGNMWFLHIFGNNVEAHFGKVKYILFYVICGVLGSAAQIAIDPTSTIYNLGASGAISGVLGAYLVYFPHARVEIIVPFSMYGNRGIIPAHTMLWYWIFYQFLFGFGSLGSSGGGVAFFAHIGGFFAGYGIARWLQGQEWNERFK